MAVTSVIIPPKGISGTLASKYTEESITERFQIIFDAPIFNLPLIILQAHFANPRFPDRGQSWPLFPDYGLFAKKFQLEDGGELGTHWNCSVGYEPLQPGESNTEGVSDNPLFWPPTWNLEEFEYDEVVAKGKNVQAFSGHYPRAALTLGAFVNSFGDETEEPIVEPASDAIFVRTDNVATLNEILQVQDYYRRTCNSDTIYGIGPRRFKFLNCKSGGQQTANGISYYQRIIRVQLMKSTDRTINNVGWQYEKDSGSEVTQHDGSQPVFLTTAGKKSSTPVTIEYRYLDEVTYASILT